MNIESLIDINKAKKNLAKSREHKINKKIVQMNKEKLAANRPEKHRLPVHIRSKIIQKKNFKTVVEKTKEKEIELQDNVTAMTFVYRSEKYQKILAKTRKVLALDPVKIRDVCTMLIGYGQ
jgi:hypothetical protein